LASAIPEVAPAVTAEPANAGFAAARAAAEANWVAYWSKSGVELADAELERTWYRNLYFLHCAVREGVTCPGLFANWSYGKIGTPWHGDYHMNYNTQQPFWVTFSSNHLEKHLPYVAMVEHLLPMSRAWAKDYYEMRGAFFPHTAYPVEMTLNPYPVPTWGWEVFETPWTVQSLWWHYRYTCDRAFLEQRAFEPIRQATLFMIDYMMRPDAHGDLWGDDRYHVFPTVPPELYGLRPGFKRNADGLSDLTLTKFLFEAFSEACKALGRQEEEAQTLEAIQMILAHYPDYPTAETECGRTFVSVRGEEPGIVYNCPASTVTVFPGDEHGLHSDQEDYAMALRSYRHQQNEGGNELVFLNLQAARLGVLDLDRFKRQVAYCELPNGTCTDKVLQSGGRYKDATKFDYMAPHGIWFENFALPVVINECLLQSYTGIIRLFPNWPDDCDARFSTLRAVGAFLVSCERRDGEIRLLTIESEKGGTCQLYTPWPDVAVRVLEEGEGVPLVAEAGGIIAFETVAGKTYTLCPAG
jgi:alpha-L-fucosidase 2